LVIARLQEVVPEHPTGETIVLAPGLPSPILDNLAKSFGIDSDFI